MKNLAVTISVFTYNSSRFVIETLESIKAQTYPNLILHICDDKSTDNTIEICSKWIETNMSRFISTAIIVPERNTGVSANFNRAWDACETEYNKDIAGDDILLPNCIEENMKYVNEHPEAVVIFGKIIAFGQNKEREDHFNYVQFDYSIFNKTQDEQLSALLFDRNVIPAASVFINNFKVRQLGIRNDERIPMMEDRPKWINFIRKGVKLHFIDKVLVAYRVSETSLSTSSIASPLFFKSSRLFYYYYVYDELLKINREKCIEDTVNNEIGIYNNYYQLRHEYKNLLESKSYKAFIIIVNPIRRLFSIIKRFI